MERACGHILTANSKALSLAGITKDTIAVAGGEIDHDRAGELTGILKENACAMVKKIIKKTPAQRQLALRKAIYHAVSHGLTSVQTMDLREGS